MSTKIFGIITLFSAVAYACDGPSSRLHKRATPGALWTYEQSQDWGRISPEYELCQTGTQQAPIPLNLQQGLSTEHIPRLNYSGTVSGSYYNWGYGPAFELGSPCTDGSAANNCTVDTNAPNLTFEENGVNETVYLVSWHIHTPADHTVQGDRSKAELHLVHVDINGSERVVLAIRIDPGILSYSYFLAEAPFGSSNDSTISNAEGFPNFNNTQVRLEGTNDPGKALRETGDFRELWTYQGSLTSPPCREGIRFYVSRNILFVSNAQMQDILRVSAYSARAEQEVWMHSINV